jgi:hypothetical protein
LPPPSQEKALEKQPVSESAAPIERISTASLLDELPKASNLKILTWARDDLPLLNGPVFWNLVLARIAAGAKVKILFPDPRLICKPNPQLAISPLFFFC